MLKSAGEWLKEPQFKGITVLDPDGWDRSALYMSWAEPITEEEMEARLMASTCRWSGPLTMRIPSCL